MRRHPLWLTVLLVLALAVSGVSVHAHAMGGAQGHAALPACDGGACEPGRQHHHGPDTHGESAGMSCASAIGHCAGAVGAPATLPIAIGPAGSPFDRPAGHDKLTGPLPDTDTPPPRI